MVRFRDLNTYFLLARNLESAGGEVTKDLYDLAMQSSWFKNSRFKGGKGKGVGGAGLGFKERPALGFSGGGQYSLLIGQYSEYSPLIGQPC